MAVYLLLATKNRCGTTFFFYFYYDLKIVIFEYSISDNLDICSDKINQTVDYKSIYKNVSFKFFEKKYNLIENLAYQIATMLIEKFPLWTYIGSTISNPLIPLFPIVDEALLNSLFE